MFLTGSVPAACLVRPGARYVCNSWRVVEVSPAVAKVRRVTSRNVSFQQWQALLSNRTKRHRAGEFLVQGVRPITLAVHAGWPVRTLLYDASRPLSGWASDLLAKVTAERVAVAPDLLRELGGDRPTSPATSAQWCGPSMRSAVRPDRHWTCRGSVRSQVGAGEHRLAVHGAGGSGAVVPGSAGVGREHAGTARPARHRRNRRAGRR